VSGEDDGLEAELADGMVELRDRLRRRVHRDERRRRHAVGEITELGRQVTVEGAACRLADLGLAYAEGEQAIGRIADGVVDAEVVESRAEQAGQHGGRPVERLLGRQPPPRQPRQADRTSLLERQCARRLREAEDGVQLFDGSMPGQRVELVAHGGQELDRVAVGIDHGMPEAGTDPGGGFRHGRVIANRGAVRQRAVRSPCTGLRKAPPANRLSPRSPAHRRLTVRRRH